MGVQILLVEDDKLLGHAVGTLMKENGYEVKLAGTKLEAEQILNYAMKHVEPGNELRMAVIDINLPDGSGFDLCAKIRKCSMIPILFLTANDEEESIVKGLDLGADDYIVKPFRKSELLSRMKAHLRRQSINVASESYCSGNLRVDFEKHEVYINGKQTELRPVEYELLRIFIANPLMILKRGVLLDKMWDQNENFVDDTTLTVQVSRLRSQLGKYEGQDYIATVRGYGYRWSIPVVRS